MDGDKTLTKILYSAPCPLQSVWRYDAQYMPIDCDVEILSDPDEKMIGLKGKAQGIHRNINISGPKKNHILIKNVMTFHD